jgi:competence ComEA-like helix-hairpin-helix protein
MNRMKPSILILCFAAAAGAQTLPDGPGKAVVEKMCTACHELDNVVRTRMTKEGWRASVEDMVSRGATGTDQEIEQVIAYLAEHFKSDVKKVNINKASATELTAALDISATDAAAIVSYRTDKGSFKELGDVMKVPGIDTKKIEAARDRLEF